MHFIAKICIFLIFKKIFLYEYSLKKIWNGHFVILNKIWCFIIHNGTEKIFIEAKNMV